jgi:enoyl-CoA hydratase/carnithine racemase
VTEPTVLTEQRGQVGIIILNRPAKLNALNRQLLTELAAAVERLEDDEGVGCLVVTGAGDRAFSAGGDLQELSEQHAASPASPIRSPATLLRARKKPVVAAIRGYCFGGGALMSLGCDVRIGADDARFKFHGAQYGVASGSAQLPQIVGYAKAKELLLTGDEIDAQTALRIGLLNHVVPAAELLDFSVGMASRIAANSPAAVAILKQVMDLALPTEAALDREETLNHALSGAPDRRQRIQQAAARVTGRRS